MIVKVILVYFLFLVFSIFLNLLRGRGLDIGEMIDFRNLNLMLFGLIGGLIVGFGSLLKERAKKEITSLVIFGITGSVLGVLLFFCNKLLFWPIGTSFIISGFLGGVLYFLLSFLMKRLLRNLERFKMVIFYIFSCIIFIISFSLGLILHFPIYLFITSICYGG